MENIKNIKFQIGEKLKDTLYAEVMPDLKKVKILNEKEEEIGKGTISYASMRPDSFIINYIDYIKFNDKGKKILKDNKVKIKYDKIKFRIPEKSKNELKERFISIYEDFKNDILNKSIPIKINIAGVDNPHCVLSCDIDEYKGLNAWELCYYYFKEDLNIYRAEKWINKEYKKQDADVTSLVINKIYEVNYKRQEKKEEFEKLFKKAKETNEKQLIYSRVEECNDSEKSCNIDQVYIYAMPDGSVDEERIHSY